MLESATFFSIWYWALAVSLWSEIGASAHGVPARLLRDAQKGDPQAAAIADALARRRAARTEALHGRWGVIPVAAASALVAALSVFAFVAGSEIALGLLLIAAPALALALLGAHEALLIHRHQPGAQILLEVLVARRRAHLSAGLFSLAGSILVFAMLHRDRLPAFAPM